MRYKERDKLDSKSAVLGGCKQHRVSLVNIRTFHVEIGCELCVLTQQGGAAIPQRVALVSGDVEGWQGVEAPLQQRF